MRYFNNVKFFWESLSTTLTYSLQRPPEQLLHAYALAPHRQHLLSSYIWLKEPSGNVEDQLSTGPGEVI